MSITLTCTWNPRGETSRLLRITPQLAEVYREITIILPPEADLAQTEPLKALGMMTLELSPDWSWGRYLALKKALETDSTHLHYADMDRLVRWVETQPDEWRQTVEFIQQCDCLVRAGLDAVGAAVAVGVNDSRDCRFESNALF